MDSVSSHRYTWREIANTRIDLVEVAVDDPGAFERWAAGASAPRRAKAARFCRVADAVRCLASEAVLRDVLRAEREIDLEAATWSLSPLGKPFLADHPGVHFNMSHSGDWLACVVSDCAVGIDVEAAVAMRDWPADQFMSCVELERHRRVADRDQAAGFYRLWTLKESVLKAMGVGLSLDPRRLTIDDIDGHWRIRGDAAPVDAADWVLKTLPTPGGVHGAVCIAAARRCQP